MEQWGQVEAGEQRGGSSGWRRFHQRPIVEAGRGLHRMAVVEVPERGFVTGASRFHQHHHEVEALGLRGGSSRWKPPPRRTLQQGYA
jgi:hypothetical protein